MQSDHKEIYRLTSLRTGKSQDTYKDVGNYVFASLYSTMRKPKSLIIKLKGVGCWYLRKKRMEIVTTFFIPDHTKQATDFSTELEWKLYQNRMELYKIFKERLIEYEEYIKIRDAIRQKRYETQTIIPPNGD
jgi:hypothetical protein